MAAQQPSDGPGGAWAGLRRRLVPLAIGVGAVWALSLYALLVDESLIHHLGLVPRRLDGLPGLLGMPFVHGSIPHLLANTGPLAIFGAILLSRGKAYWLGVTLAVALLGGAALWLFGREALHVGASGVVFGYFGFLVARGLRERRLTSLAVTVLVIVLYSGSMIYGLLPRGNGVSWEAHLFGLLAGAAVAWLANAMDKRRGAAR